jgi:hypothetical protein
MSEMPSDRPRRRSSIGAVEGGIGGIGTGIKAISAVQRRKQIQFFLTAIALATSVKVAQESLVLDEENCKKAESRDKLMSLLFKNTRNSSVAKKLVANAGLGVKNKNSAADCIIATLRATYAALHPASGIGLQHSALALVGKICAVQRYTREFIASRKGALETLGKIWVTLEIAYIKVCNMCVCHMCLCYMCVCHM